VTYRRRTRGYACFGQVGFFGLAGTPKVGHDGARHLSFWLALPVGGGTGRLFAALGAGRCCGCGHYFRGPSWSVARSLREV